jgi:hypothetical protein
MNPVIYHKTTLVTASRKVERSFTGFKVELSQITTRTTRGIGSFETSLTTLRTEALAKYAFSSLGSSVKTSAVDHVNVMLLRLSLRTDGGQTSISLKGL